MYKVFDTNVGIFISNEGENATTTFACATANTDYQTFKAQINADEAQLEDADGQLMTPEEAKAFVATLP